MKSKKYRNRKSKKYRNRKSKKYRNRNRKRKSKNAGVIINTLSYQSPKEALNAFIGECKKPSGSIDLLETNSNAGRIAILELPQDSISPYTSYSVGTFINPDIGNVRRIIIKFCLLSSDLNDFNDDNETYLPVVGSGEEIQVVSSSRFLKEVNNQQYIALTTANNDKVGSYHMATPYIVYTYDGTNANDLSRDINSVLNHNDGDEDYAWDSFRQQVNTLQQDKNGSSINVKLGVIAMTIAVPDKYQLVENIRMVRNSAQNPESVLYRIPVVYELLRIALFCKLIHNDFHDGNYFVEKIPDDLDIGRRVVKVDDPRVVDLQIDRTVSLEWWKMKAILIDWGEVITWSPDNVLIKKWNQVATNSLDIGITFFQTLIEKIIQVDNLDKFTKYIILYEKPVEEISRYLAQYHKLCFFATVDNHRAISDISVKPPALVDSNTSFTPRERSSYRRLIGSVHKTNKNKAVINRVKKNLTMKD